MYEASPTATVQRLRSESLRCLYASSGLLINLVGVVHGAIAITSVPRLPRILQYIRDEHTQHAPASRVKLENAVSGSRKRPAAAANQEDALDLPGAAQQAAALVGVLIEHGRMR